jgi:hypothetical protein
LCEDVTFTATHSCATVTVELTVTGGDPDPATATGTGSATVTVHADKPGIDQLVAVATGGGDSATLQVDVQFPRIDEIRADATVEAQRAADWTASSGAGGDHDERGGWIYFSGDTCEYRCDPWVPVSFWYIIPSPQSPAADEWMVGNYHCHATLRNWWDVLLANLMGSFITGPSTQDESFASTNDSPGLLRERHTNEVVASCHRDYYYGPIRRSTPVDPPPPTVTKSDGVATGGLDDRHCECDEARVYTTIAKLVLCFMDAPYVGRKTTVTMDDATAIVTFHPPENSLGGAFIVKFDRRTWKIIDVQLWR